MKTLHDPVSHIAEPNAAATVISLVEGTAAVANEVERDPVRSKTNLTADEQSALNALENTIIQGKTMFLLVARALWQIRSQRLYRATHDRFGDYVFDRFRFTRQHAYRYVQASEVEAALRSMSPVGDIKLPTSERAFRELARIDGGEARMKTLELAVNDAKDGDPTSAEIRQTAVKLGFAKAAVPKPARIDSDIIRRVAQLRSAITASASKEVLLELLKALDECVQSIAICQKSGS